jgi:hypothetical protein
MVSANIPAEKLPNPCAARIASRPIHYTPARSPVANAVLMQKLTVDGASLPSVVTIKLQLALRRVGGVIFAPVGAVSFPPRQRSSDASG